MPKNRSAALDAVRVLAILAVILGHMPDMPDVVRPATYAWHVPVFFLLSGYLWRAGRPPGDELRRRGRSLALPYLSWLLLLGVPLAVTAVRTGRDLPLLLWQTLTLVGGHAVYTTFWFVGALFFAAVAGRYLEAGPRWFAWTLAVGSVAATLVAKESMSSLPLWVGLALPSLFFIMVGQELRRFRDRIPAATAVGAALLVAGAAAAVTGFTAPLDMKSAYLGTPGLSVAVAVAVGVGLILVAEATAVLLPRPVQSALVRLAACGLVVVLLHPAALLLIHSHTHLAPWPLYLAVTAATWTVALVVAVTPLAPWLVGAPRAHLRPTTVARQAPDTSPVDDRRVSATAPTAS